MSEEAWIVILMGAGAVLEAAGVAVIAIEIRSTRKATEAFARDAQRSVQNPTDPNFPIGDLLMGMVKFMVDVTSGSRNKRIAGLIWLLTGIAATLWANLWALRLSD